MPVERKALSLAAQVGALTRIQLSSWRWSWRQMVLTGMLGPILTVGALHSVAGRSDDQVTPYILSGSLTMALFFQMLNKVATNFSFMHVTGALEYYSSMPVRRTALIAATLLAFGLLAAPAVAVTLLVGVFILGPALHVSLALIPAILVCIVPAAGLGAWVGSRSPSLEQASSSALGLTLVMLAVGPVMIPADRLPDALVWLGYLNPGTYVSGALRLSLAGPAGGALLADLGVLVVLAVVVWFGVAARIPWRAAPRNASGIREKRLEPLVPRGETS